jgi:hypothetical protein
MTRIAPASGWSTALIDRLELRRWATRRFRLIAPA